MGIPITLIAEAVFSRCLSALKDERVRCSHVFENPPKHQPEDPRVLIEHIKNVLFSYLFKALYASKIISYAQGFMLLREASTKFNWELNFGEIAMIWRGGCIIKSRFLFNIYESFQTNPKLACLFIDQYFSQEIKKCLKSWREVISICVLHGIPVPAFSSALSFFDGYRTAQLPANLLQVYTLCIDIHRLNEIILDPTRSSCLQILESSFIQPGERNKDIK
uniref:phosphogluconate dehydrogenase (NADP(+)-dependent, decarboxylating) n=1 Tax=Henneguya salminicola TaxID=69463 RepID=A0A6G3MHS5_HENSL